MHWVLSSQNRAGKTAIRSGSGIARGERHSDQRRASEQKIDAARRPTAQSAEPGNPMMMTAAIKISMMPAEG
jgi:hypothetical protein